MKKSYKSWLVSILLLKAVPRTANSQDANKHTFNLLKIIKRSTFARREYAQKQGSFAVSYPLSSESIEGYG